jgi:hypothetical protein
MDALLERDMAASYREIGTAKWRAPAEMPAAESAPASSVGGAVAVGQPLTASVSTLGLHLPTTVQAGSAAMPAETEESPVVADVVIAAPLVEKKVCLCVCVCARACVCDCVSRTLVIHTCAAVILPLAQASCVLMRSTTHCTRHTAVSCRWARKTLICCR